MLTQARETGTSPGKMEGRRWRWRREGVVARFSWSGHVEGFSCVSGMFV
jgi:hypothetical protein